MTRHLCHSLWLGLLFVLCQWLAPAPFAPLGSAFAAVPGVTCNATFTNLSFGNVDPTTYSVNGAGNSNANLQTTGYLTYTCQNTGTTAQSISICVSIGNPGGGARAMSGPSSAKLNYQLYQDASMTPSSSWGSAYNNTWGHPYQTTATVPASGTSAPITIPIYAAISQNQGTNWGWPFNFSSITQGAYSATYASPNDVRFDINPSSNTTCQAGSGGGTATGFTVSANVQATCYVTTNPLTFPATPSGTAGTVTAQTTVSVNCADGDTQYDIGLDNGQNYSGGNRRMRGGPTFSDYVSYGLYADSGYSQAWGNTQGSNTYRTIAPGQITQSSQTFTIYGKLLSTPTVPGDYYDVVAVYVYY